MVLSSLWGCWERSGRSRPPPTSRSTQSPRRPARPRKLENHLPRGLRGFPRWADAPVRDTLATAPPATFFFFKLELSKHLFTGLDQLRKQGPQSVVPKPQSARRHPKTLWAPCIGQTLLGVKATCPIWARALQTRFEVTTPHFSIAVVLPGESGDRHSYLFFFLSVWFPHNQTIWTRRGYLRA